MRVARMVVGERLPRIERPHVAVDAESVDRLVGRLERAAMVATELCVVARDAVDLERDERVPEEVRAAGHHLVDALGQWVLVHFDTPWTLGPRDESRTLARRLRARPPRLVG